MSIQHSLKSYLCIDYPGLVENEWEAIRTLGGMQRLNQTFSRRNTKLLLNFNPDNLFSKILCSSQIEEAASAPDVAATAAASAAAATAFNETTVSTANDDLDNTDNMTSGNLNNSFGNATTSNVSSMPKQNEFISMPCLLMSVKKVSTDSNKFDVKIIGKIKKVYTFKKIADFQYLPMSCSSMKKPAATDSVDSATAPTLSQAHLTQYTYTSFYENFLFTNLQDYEHEFCKNQLPQLFILPPFFSRFDDPVSYAFRSEPIKKPTRDESADETTARAAAASKQASSKTPSRDHARKPQTDSPVTSSADASLADLSMSSFNASQDETSNIELIRSMRQERSTQAFLVTFSRKDIPKNPSEKLKPPRNEAQIECISILKTLFNERPCFLKSVLLCITSFSATLLKESLPYVAYYFTTGPWRSCWVRFGYDPRQHPEAKMYQIIDYRLRNNVEPDQIVKAKPRSSYHKRKFRSDLADPELDDYKNFKIEKEMYKFNPNKFPVSRNVFYQICDIEDDDVQNFIKSDANSSNKCSEKDGWFSENIQNRCRDIMSQKHEKLAKYISQENKAEKQIKK